MAAIFGALALVVACGTSSSDPSGQSCDDLASSARNEVEQAIAANLACSGDADCETIPFSTSCFDSCTRGASKSGHAAIESAKSRVDAAQCATFRQQGCRATIPPCDPPPKARCVDGKCQ